jgi:endonuclease YncB( thermonuclease family)
MGSIPICQAPESFPGGSSISGAFLCRLSVRVPACLDRTPLAMSSQIRPGQPNCIERLEIGQVPVAKRTAQLTRIPAYGTQRTMKKFITGIVMVIAWLLAFPTFSLAGEFTVTKVYDGDTIMAEGHDIVIYILLAGIDAPEMASREGQPHQPYAKEAKRYLESLILNKTVDIKGYSIGPYPYDDLVGEIYLRDKNINMEMVKNGLAEVWLERPPEGFDITPYLEAERKAKAAKRGMWSLGRGYMSPRDWRRIHPKR